MVSRNSRYYHKNKKKISIKRKTTYRKKKKAGTCTRCKRKALKYLTVCSYHRKKQQEYNSRR